MARAKRDRAEIVKAIRRVHQEELLTLEDLARLATRTMSELPHGISHHALRRWILEGKSRHFLDGIHEPGRGWLSSVPALRRFLAECNAAKSESVPAPAA